MCVELEHKVPHNPCEHQVSVRLVAGGPGFSSEYLLVCVNDLSSLGRLQFSEAGGLRGGEGGRRYHGSLFNLFRSDKRTVRIGGKILSGEEDTRV